MNLGPGANKLGKRIAPGIWEDADGHIHWSLPELLALVELPDTPEHREIVKQILLDMMKKQAPNAKVIFRKTPEDEGEDLR